MSNRTRIKPPAPPRGQGKVILGYVHPGMVHAEFMRSVVNLMAYDWQHSKRLFDGGGLIEYQAGANLSGPRNILTRMFLELPAEWLLMVDADMAFEPWALDHLVDKADPVERPIVGGLCFGLEADGSHSPTLFDIFADPDGKPEVGRYREWPVGELMKVAGTGTAFLLIHRSVFERFDNAELPEGATAFNKAFPYFQETEYFGKPIGEDLTFCFRAGFLGIPVYVDTSCHIGHVKTRVLDFASYVGEYKRSEELVSV